MHRMMYMAEKRESNDSKFIGTLLVLFALYLLGIESYQLYKSGLGYFTSFWNYLDFCPPIMICIFVYMTFVEHYFDNREEDVITTEATL